MGYPIRDLRPNITHHVTSKCIDDCFLMNSDKLKSLFLEQIKKAQIKYTFELNSFTIMDNHFHLVIRIIDKKDTISKIMQYIKSLFAKIYNKLMKRSGPFWNSRYKSKVIEVTNNPIEYLINTLIYLAYNPVKSKISKIPSQYKYSSFNCYLSHTYKPLIKVTLHPLFFKLGKTLKDCFNEFNLKSILYEEKINNHSIELEEIKKIYDFNYQNK